MKKLIFLFLLLPCFVQAQNYLFEITPTAGEFRVLVTDDTKEAYPRDITDFGEVDTAALQLLAYQRIENARSRQASLMAQSFLAELNAEQTAAAIGAVVPLNYSAWINSNLAGVYDGIYQYAVRGTAVNYPVVITGAELRRQSNNNLLATLSARSNNWLRATVNGTGEVVNLYQFGNAWVGKNAAGQVVTLKKL
jgi:hypothetical protein